MASSNELAPEEAVVAIARDGAALRVPAMGVGDVRKIVVVPLRSGAQHVEVYVGLAWTAAGHEPATGPGVSVFQLHRGASGVRLVSGASCDADSECPEDLDRAIARLEEEQAMFRPKPVAAGATKARARAVKRLTETDGAGSLANTPVIGEPRRASDAEVDDAERALGTRFPAGYRTLLPRHTQRARLLGRGLHVAVAKVVRAKRPTFEAFNSKR